MDCNFSPVACSVFGLDIRWYSLAYICGIIASVYISKSLVRYVNEQSKSNVYSIGYNAHIDNFVNIAVVSIVIGGRLGHVLFYDFDYYFDNPLEILKIWNGGMSFYGAFASLAVAMRFYCKSSQIDLMQFADLWSTSAPIGLFFGRISNFVNGELLGHESSITWAVKFKDGIPRHPSQLYEAMLEGVLLLLLMILLFFKMHYYKYRGKLFGAFCCGYAVARFVAEFFRSPDSELSQCIFLYSGLNFNQIISLLMLAVGFHIGMRNRS